MSLGSTLGIYQQAPAPLYRCSISSDNDDMQMLLLLIQLFHRRAFSVTFYILVNLADDSLRCLEPEIYVTAFTRRRWHLTSNCQTFELFFLVMSHYFNIEAHYFIPHPPLLPRIPFRTALSPLSFLSPTYKSR